MLLLPKSFFQKPRNQKVRLISTCKVLCKSDLCFSTLLISIFAFPFPYPLFSLMFPLFSFLSFSLMATKVYFKLAAHALISSTYTRIKLHKLSLGPQFCGKVSGRSQLNIILKSIRFDQSVDLD